MKRTPIKRSTKPIPKRGPKAQREKPELDAARADVIVRSGGWCEATGIASPDDDNAICSPFRHTGHGAHHVWPEDHDSGVHDPDRMKWLCTVSHSWVHAHPAHSKRLGLMRPDPPAECGTLDDMPTSEGTES